MRHNRQDYDRRIQDSEGLIPEDEPVFLIRAQDMCAQEAIQAWIRQAKETGAPETIINAAREQYFAICEWQIEHGSKIPDMP